jgi:dolichol-phosphate mannosyltransferase
MISLSIVSPVYNTGSTLPELVNRLNKAASAISDRFEIILVDDGSPDQSWKTITALAEEYPFIKGMKLTRNFGQHAAIAAGLSQSTGNWVVVIDSDLQDPPEAIPALYEETKKGFSVVLAKRQTRNDSLYRRLASKLFYRLLSWLSGIPADHTIANFGIYSRQVINEITAMNEYHRFFPIMVHWTGFNKTAINYEHAARSQGVSGYNFKKLTRLGLSIILSYSDKPLRYIVKLGFVISLATFLYGIVVLIQYFTGAITVLGYTSLILSIWFLGGLILFTLGMVGLYTGRTFEEVKKRPQFIVEKTTDTNDHH